MHSALISWDITSYKCKVMREVVFVHTNDGRQNNAYFRQTRSQLAGHMQSNKVLKYKVLSGSILELATVSLSIKYKLFC